MPDEIHGEALTAVEAALVALTPLPARMERDQLMYRAGQRSAPRAGWLWRGVSVGLATLSVALGTALVMQPTLAPGEHIVYVQRPAPPAPAVVSRPPAPRDADT